MSLDGMHISAPENIAVLRCKTEFELNLGQYIGVSPNGKKPDNATKAAAEMISLYKKVNAAAQQAQIQEITVAVCSSRGTSGFRTVFTQSQ